MIEFRREAENHGNKQTKINIVALEWFFETKNFFQ